MTIKVTDINILLDRSGSMFELWKDTIGGLKAFIKAQRELPGETFFSLFTFDNEFSPVVVGEKLELVNEDVLDVIQPRGGTALLDAMGRSILSAHERNIKESKENSHVANSDREVIFVIITDGQENMSKEMKADAIQKMVKEHEEAHKWKFIFLGADMDAIAESGKIGINSSINYSNNTTSVANAWSTADVYIGSTRLSNLGISGAANISYSIMNEQSVDTAGSESLKRMYRSIVSSVKK